MDVDQAERDQEEQRGHCGERDVRGEGRNEGDHDEQECCGEHTREPGLRARFVVGAGAVERSGRRVARGECADDVRQTLADELLIAVDALAGTRRDRASAGDCLGEPDDRQRQRDRREGSPGSGGKIRQR